MSKDTNKAKDNMICSEFIINKYRKFRNMEVHSLSDAVISSRLKWEVVRDMDDNELLKFEDNLYSRKHLSSINCGFCKYAGSCSICPVIDMCYYVTNLINANELSLEAISNKVLRYLDEFESS